jgi:hypothetical protein
MPRLVSTVRGPLRAEVRSVLRLRLPTRRPGWSPGGIPGRWSVLGRGGPVSPEPAWSYTWKVSVLQSCPVRSIQATAPPSVTARSLISREGDHAGVGEAGHFGGRGRRGGRWSPDIVSRVRPPAPRPSNRGRRRRLRADAPRRCEDRLGAAPLRVRRAPRLHFSPNGTPREVERGFRSPWRVVG